MGNEISSGVEASAGETDKIILHRRTSSTIPIEAENITPDLFRERNRKEIEALPVFYGRRKMALGDLFFVEGERSENIVVKGDLQHVKKIGQGMSRGRITVMGHAGPHLGAHMRGGEIIVQGNVGDWAGAHMAGGRLWINGNVGHHGGAAYPGEKRGINRGVMIVMGNAGSRIGALMRRGLIVVMGDAGEFAGTGMIAGTVFVFGHLSKRAGAGMKRGTIVAMGPCDPLLPTYRFESTYQPVFIMVLLNYLEKLGVPVGSTIQAGLFRRYSGDINTLGKGEILIHDQHECKGL